MISTSTRLWLTKEMEKRKQVERDLEGKEPLELGDCLDVITKGK